jgi:hypothetical protein
MLAMTQSIDAANGVRTRSGSDRVSPPRRHRQDRNPVATAPGTDLIKLYEISNVRARL